jgi:enoyl-CoA hydratase
MADEVSYRETEGVAHIAIDDGKVNALTLEILTALHEAVDRADADGFALQLEGRAGVFSAGFHLPTLTGGGEKADHLLDLGFGLAERLFQFPRPVVAAVTGHAIAMGFFLTVACDYRVGVDGPYRLTANEVAIGMGMPAGVTEMCRSKLPAATVGRVLTLAEPFMGQAAVAAGLLDVAVDQESVHDVATSKRPPRAEHWRS